MALHLVELDKNTCDWTYLISKYTFQLQVLRQHPFKKLYLRLFSSYKQTHERSCFAKTIDPREWDPRLLSTLQHSLYNQPWLRIRKKDFVYSNSTDPKPLCIQLELYFLSLSNMRFASLRVASLRVASLRVTSLRVASLRVASDDDDKFYLKITR
jgi:hypothetical protein